MVGDLSLGQPPISSDPTGFAKIGAYALFIATDVRHGRELWRTDGTADGTELLLDLEPGTESANIDELVSAGGRAFFIRSPTVAGRRHSGALELWKGDGSAAGTSLVAPLTSGVYDETIAAVGEDVVIVLYEVEQQTFELWRSDGTLNGTRRIIAPKSMPPPGGLALTSVGAFALFETYDASTGFAVASTDGTVPGTHSLGDQASSGRTNTLGSVVAIGGGAAFLSAAGLVVTDGSVHGTKTLPIPDGVFARQLAALDDRLYVVLQSLVGDAELWRANDNATALERVGAIPTPDFLVASGNRLIFAERHSSGYWIWAADAAGATTLLHATQPFESLVNPMFTATTHLTYFDSIGEGNNATLWRTDGTAEGTFEVGSGFATPLGAFDDQLLYSAWIAGELPFPQFSRGEELFASDGTPSGTGVLRNIADEAEQSVGSDPHLLTVFKDRLYFAGGLPSFSGQGMWVSDGTRAGTRLLHTFDSVDPITAVAVANDRLYVQAGFSLWVTDGDQPLREVSGFRSPPAGLQVIDGTLFTLGFDLCRIDADAKPACGLVGLREVYQVAQLDGRFYVIGRADGALNSGALLATDLTPAGTHLLADAEGNALTVFHDHLYFLSGDDNAAPALWESDGTEAGTRMVRTFDKPPLDDVQQLVLAGDRLFFVLGSCPGAQELWATDGTTSGTRFLSDFASDCSLAPQLAAFDDRLYFAGSDAQHGVELWRSNGSRDGTGLVRDLMPGLVGSRPREIRAVGDRLLFSTCGAEGCEPFSSDGTAAGTRRVADIAAGAASSNPSGFVRTSTHLFFAADDHVHGDELWAMSLVGADCAGDCSADGRITVDELVTGVSIALGGRPLTECVQLDGDGNGAVSVDELVAAVAHALDGCAA